MTTGREQPLDEYLERVREWKSRLARGEPLPTAPCVRCGRDTARYLDTGRCIPCLEQDSDL